MSEATRIGDGHHDFSETNSGRVASGLIAEVVVKLLNEARRAVGRDSDAAQRGIARIARAVALLTEAGEGAAVADAAGQPVSGGLAPWQIRLVKAHIEANIHRDIRVKDLTAVTRLSPSYFSTVFRRSFGETPHAYLVRRRIVRAQELMLTTDEPLSQIALACGLCDQAHLSRLFRRATNMSPNHWRRERRSAPHLACAA